MGTRSFTILQFGSFLEVSISKKCGMINKPISNDIKNNNSQL